MRSVRAGLSLALVIAVGVSLAPPAGAAAPPAGDPLAAVTAASGGSCADLPDAAGQYVCVKQTKSTPAAMPAALAAAGTGVSSAFCQPGAWVTRRFEACGQRITYTWTHWEVYSNRPPRVIGQINLTTSSYYRTGLHLGIHHEYAAWRSTAGIGTYNRPSLTFKTIDRICDTITNQDFKLTATNTATAKRTRTCHIPAGKNQKVGVTKLTTMLVPGSSKGAAMGWADLNAPKIRCDDETYLSNKTACVFKDVVPTWTINGADARGKRTAAHIKRAQATLKDHWGLRGQGTVLTRWRYTGTGENPNRKVACKGFKKKNASDSCDEFPFASTAQGAYFMGKSRTSVAHVPAADNKYNGSLLAKFFRDNRILAGDRFWVKVT